MPTFRFNDRFGEWEEEADTQWQAEIEASITKAERAAEHVGRAETASNDAYESAKQDTRDRIAANGCTKCGLHNTPGHICISPEIATATYDSYSGSYVTQQVPGKSGTHQRVVSQVNERQPDPVGREQKNSGGNWLVIAACLALVGVCLWAAFIH